MCIGLYFGQEKLLFNPSKLSQNHHFRSGEELNINVAKGVDLNCLWLKEEESRGVILYLHGNKGSNRRCLRQARSVAGNKYDIFMPDYRGFGKSGGAIRSQKAFYADIQKVYDFLKSKYEEDKIAIVGYSLGSGLASYLAANNSPRRLFLVAPFISFIDLKNRILPFIPNFIIKYPLSNYKNLKSVKCPVTLFHGTEDEVIPYESSVKLQKINTELIELVTLKNEGHRGAIFNGLFRQKVTQALMSMN